MLLLCKIYLEGTDVGQVSIELCEVDIRFPAEHILQGPGEARRINVILKKKKDGRK